MKKDRCLQMHKKEGTSYVTVLTFVMPVCLPDTENNGNPHDRMSRQQFGRRFQREKRMNQRRVKK